MKKNGLKIKHLPFTVQESSRTQAGLTSQFRFLNLFIYLFLNIIEISINWVPIKIHVSRSGKVIAEIVKIQISFLI